MHEKYTDNMAIKKLKKRTDKKKLYQPGGMYSSNTIPTGLNTTNLVAEESNPQILDQQKEKLASTFSSLKTQADNASNTIEQDRLEADAMIERNAANSTAAIDSGVNMASNLANKFISPEGAEKQVNPFSSALNAGRITKASNLAQKATAGNSAGMNLITNAKAANKAASLAQKAGGSVMSSAETGKTIVTNAAGNVVKQGSSIGAGLKNFATSGAGIGTIASLAGAGVSRLSDDNDATTMKFGEGAGKVLSGVGTGIGAAATAAAIAGTALGPAGTLIGAGLGAVYGLGKGLIQRGKARREKREYKSAEKQYIGEQTDIMANKFGVQSAALRAAQVKSKTISGYDLGNNTSRQTGGLRMGMPRY